MFGDAPANTRTRACFGNVNVCWLMFTIFCVYRIIPLFGYVLFGQHLTMHMVIHRLELSNAYMLPPCGTRGLKSCDFKMGPLKEARTPTEPTGYFSGSTESKQGQNDTPCCTAMYAKEMNPTNWKDFKEIIL